MLQPRRPLGDIVINLMYSGWDPGTVKECHIKTKERILVNNNEVLLIVTNVSS